MKPRPQSDPQLRLFEKPLQEIINVKHRLVGLAGIIPWDSVCKPLEEKFSDDTGRPALPARLVVGAHYLSSCVRNIKVLKILPKEEKNRCYFLPVMLRFV
jgi:hypothetical protein